MNKQEENKEELLLVPKSKFCALCIHIDCESCDEVERYKSDIEAIKQAEREKVAREIIEEIDDLYKNAGMCFGAVHLGKSLIELKAKYLKERG